MIVTESQSFDIDESAIWTTLAAAARPEAARVREILAKGREMKGLDAADIAPLMALSDPALVGELFETARHIKDTIYGKRLVIFAPLYISNLCANECLYCAFRARNKEVERRALSQELTWATSISSRFLRINPDSTAARSASEPSTTSRRTPSIAASRSAGSPMRAAGSAARWRGARRSPNTTTVIPVSVWVVIYGTPAAALR